MSRTERIVAATTDLIVDYPREITMVCLLVTVLMAPGMGLLTTEVGSDQFADDVPEADAQERINTEFEPAFDDDEPTTQLIHTSDNVLSRSGLVDMLRTKERIEERDDLRVVATNSPATTVAQQIDPTAETLTEQRQAVEASSDREVERAVQEAAEDPAFASLLGEDFNAEAAESGAMLGIVTHSFPEGGGDLTSVQREAESIADDSRGDVIVFGGGILDDEFESVVFDSLIIVVPAALLLILGLLGFAYRDPVDFLLGSVALLMTVVWTFGFTGYAGIPFSDVLVAVPVLLLAIGIDFGIHTINRYREERIAGVGIEESMDRAIGQLLIAYSIIAGTTIIGFLSNLTSDLGPIQEFGVVAGVGILFTLIIFGIFLPAAKVALDDLRETYDFPEFGSSPLGEEDSILGRILPLCVSVSRPSPAIFLVIVLLLTAGAGYYGAGVDTTFDDEDFLPPEEIPAYLEVLPEPFAPGEYTVTSTINLLEDRFETGEDDTITIYVEGRLSSDEALESLVRAEDDPPSTFVSSDGAGETDNVLAAIDAYADEDPEFAALVARSDTTGNGVPDRNVEEIYDELFESEFDDFTGQFLTEDTRSTRIDYEVRSDADAEQVTEDARLVADRYRFDATATGQIVVFQAVADVIFESAIVALASALFASGIFLVVFYHVLVGRGSLGAMNLVPVVVTICLLTAGMRYLGIPFNALTATILSITIGLGVDYTVHVSHRFYDEYEATADVYGSLYTTIRGTGGALTGTMLTTALGIGVLTLAITPILGDFGLLTGFSIAISYLAALIVLPPALVVWVAAVERRPELLWRA